MRPWHRSQHDMLGARQEASTSPCGLAVIVVMRRKLCIPRPEAQLVGLAPKVVRGTESSPERASLDSRTRSCRPATTVESQVPRSLSLLVPLPTAGDCRGNHAYGYKRVSYVTKAPFVLSSSSFHLQNRSQPNNHPPRVLNHQPPTTSHNSQLSQIKDATAGEQRQPRAAGEL